MGMKVLGYDITGQAAVEAAGCEYRSTVDEILKESDFVTIHCALTADTEGLIGKRELELMKPTAYLMNLARGPIVDEQALADAVNNGVISGAAVDVYSVEPVSSDNPVLTAKNILCTPHTSGIAAEALARMSVMCVEGCAAIIRGERWDAVADRSVYDHSRFA